MDKTKKKLLIAVHRLDTGGVQRALLSALRAIDYDLYDVTLYIRKDSVALLPEVDGRVGKVIVNRDRTHYYRRPRAAALYALVRLMTLFGKEAAGVSEKLNGYITECRIKNERERYFSGGESYDIAVSYIQGQTARFVADNVKADRKIVFYHGSTDSRHALHEAVFPCYDRIVAVNEGCARILRELYPSQADKITFIENFVDPDEVREKAKEYEPPRHEGKTVLCSCGRFTEEKGFDLALEAAAELKKSKMPFVWYFIGDGKLRGDLEKQRDALGLTDAIVFTGMLENPYPYIAGCDIYVQPSYEESQGLAAAEAQILLRPVAATDTVGARSMIRDGETGLISRTDAASLAGAIIKLHEDRGLYEKIVNDLKNVDHKEKEEVFRAAWRDLLSFDRG